MGFAKASIPGLCILPNSPPHFEGEGERHSQLDIAAVIGSGVLLRTKSKESNMSTEHLLLFLVIGVVAGFLAGKIMKGAGFGLVGDLVVGVIGSFIGVWVFGLLDIAPGTIVGLLVASVVGALLLLFVLRLVKKG